MNRENAKDYLPLVQALVDGKTIQINRDSDGDWADYTADKIIFDGPASDYRIKPEPREIWVNRLNGCDSSTHWDSEDEAKESVPLGATLHRYREVLE